MDRDAKKRLDVEKGNRTIAHYAERAMNLLDLEHGGRNLAPYRDSHNQLLMKLDAIKVELAEVRAQAQEKGT